MNRLQHTLVPLTLLALSAGSAECVARPTSGSARGEGRGEIVLAASGVSLNQAIAMVEKRYKARVVRSDTRQEGDRKIYVLRLLDDSGNAQVVRVDASSGAIL
jgi:uncharacterized membrane protein YkoI